LRVQERSAFGFRSTFGLVQAGSYLALRCQTRPSLPRNKRAYSRPPNQSAMIAGRAFAVQSDRSDWPAHAEPRQHPQRPR
jgi:hypothetical protein